MSTYCALMADIVNSRSLDIAQRASLQSRLDRSIEVLNIVYRPVLVKPVVFSAGDEVQGLFAEAPAAFFYYRMLSLLLAPYQIRGGMGLGGWETRIDGAPSNKQDGGAYHAARDAILSAKRSSFYSLIAFAEEGVSCCITAEMGGSLSLVRARSISQARVALAAELWFPLIPLAAHAERDNFSAVFDRGFTTWALREAGFELGKIKPKAYHGCPVVFDSNSIGMELNIYDGFGGLGYSLAAWIGASRQGIEQAFRRGSVFEERNAALLAAEALARWGR